MAERRKILELDIDIDRLIKAAADAKKEINELKAAQKGLNLETEEGRKQFVKNESNLKKATTNYRELQKALTAVGESTKSFNEIRKQTTSIINKETVSIAGARESNKKLLDIRNRLNLSTARGRQELERINKKIDQNNAFIKKNASELEKQKIGIGNYEGAITSALGRVNLFGLNLGSLSRRLFAAKKALDVKRAAAIKTAEAVGGLNLALTRLKFALLSTGLGAVIVALGGLAVATTLITRKNKEFATSQSTLKAILNGTTEEMKALNKEAIRLGSTTAFTATQVSNLQIEFAKLGFPTEDIINLTESTLNAAAAMGSGLAETAKLTGAALKAFGLDSSEAARVNDVLSVSTTKSALDFAKLQTSLSTIAPVANAAGFSLEDTVALLGSLSDAGFDASTAATSTRNIILNLADANGKLARSLSEPVKDLPSLIRAFSELEGNGIELSEALDLTDKRSVAAFKTFLTGTPSLEKLGEALEKAGKSGGEAAALIAALKLDNLEGDTRLLNSAWEGLILNIDNGQGVFSKLARGTIQLLTKAIVFATEANEYWAVQWEDFLYFLDKQPKIVIDRVSELFGRFALNIKQFANVVQLSLADVPIIGKSIDVSKVSQNLVDVEKELEASSRRIADINKRQQALEDRQETFAFRLAEKKIFNYNKKLEIKEKEEREKREKINEQERKKNEEELKKQLAFREKVIFESKSLADQENINFQKRLEDAGVYGIERENLTEQQLQALELLEIQHKANLAKIDADAYKGFFEAEKQAYKKEEQQRKVNYNNEFASITTLEDAKAILKDKISDEELAQIRTIEDAKSALKRSFEAKELAEQEVFLKNTIFLLKNALSGEQVEGISLGDSILSEEEKVELQGRIDDLTLQLSELAVAKADLNNNEDKKEVADIDILGFNPSQWEAAESSIEKIGLAARAAGEAFGVYSDFVAAAEQNQLRNLEQAATKKKKILKSQLESNIITQEQYNSKVGALDTNLANKRAEIEYKQAKRQKTSAIISIITDTALGVGNALSKVVTIPFAPIIAALGAVQLALVASQKIPPPPKFEKGGVFSRNWWIEGGRDHNQGGNKYYDAWGNLVAETSKDEAMGVLNKNATKDFMAFNDKYNYGQIAKPKHYATGGILSRNNTTVVQTPIDYDLLAQKIGSNVAEANKSLPSPVVAVEDIRTGVDNQVTVEQGANI